MLNIIKHIILKEFLQLKRDPALFRMALLAPILQLIILGYAATMDVDNVKTIIYDQDKTETSREFIKKFYSSSYFEIVKYTNNYDDINSYIDGGKALVAITIPNDFEKNINRRTPATIQAIFDGSEANKSSIAAGYVSGIAQSFAKDILVKNMNMMGAKLTPVGSISAETRIWYNPDLKTRNFMLPSILGLVLMVITSILMSMAVVKEREIGTLEQLIVTPIKPYQLIIGKLVPFIMLGFVDVLLVQGVMIFWFGIAIRGSFLFLLFASFLFVLSTLGIGLFISTISKTQQQAMLVAQFAVMMPMIYLSGFSFPIENMPKIIQYITYGIPLRYYITILRDVILKGSSFTELIPETVALFFMGTSILLFSALRFKKRLE
ncbi:MAG: ABC transporter permease [Bacteroidota bacterium]|nr:ABC transporter permease [Bacteroidota bacterium]